MRSPVALILAAFSLSAACFAQSQEAAALVREFAAGEVFYKQLETAQKIAALRDPAVLPQLEPWLSNEDRHIRANAALIFGSLGDPRGFAAITAILGDYSHRPEGQGIPGCCFSVPAQIRSDRYYAVHVLGVLKDPRAVPVLIPLLADPDVNYNVPWALEQIGDRAAIQGLIVALHNPSADVSVYAAQGLGDLKAKEALPDLRMLVNDTERSHLDRMLTAGEAARLAIAAIEQPQR
jgi:HEAT repeat protein